MGWVDEVPRAGGLYIGGLHALYRKQEYFKQNKITHLISALDFDIYEAGRFSEFKHIQIRLDDDPNEDFIKYFSQTNEFIEDANANGGAVFVHCAMGKSRSATIVCAYLMYKFSVTPTEAIEQLREGRGVCDPNPGFWEQLEVYHQMLKAGTERSVRIYEDWLANRYTGDWYTERRRQAPKL